ncbi:MAG: hypothetical protein KDK91_02950 [Gammaproteobacteria bacterium]|nr:hypothetical protein [Gammaproteobacteria bacterium]
MKTNVPSALSVSAAEAALNAAIIRAEYPCAASQLRLAANAGPSQLACEASKINMYISRDLHDADYSGVDMPAHQAAYDALSALVREIIL